MSLLFEYVSQPMKAALMNRAVVPAVSEYLAINAHLFTDDEWKIVDQMIAANPTHLRSLVTKANLCAADGSPYFNRVFGSTHLEASREIVRSMTDVYPGSFNHQVAVNFDAAERIELVGISVDDAFWVSKPLYPFSPARIRATSVEASAIVLSKLGRNPFDAFLRAIVGASPYQVGLWTMALITLIPTLFSAALAELYQIEIKEKQPYGPWRLSVDMIHPERMLTDEITEVMWVQAAAMQKQGCSVAWRLLCGLSQHRPAHEICVANGIEPSEDPKTPVRMVSVMTPSTVRIFVARMRKDHVSVGVREAIPAMILQIEDPKQLKLALDEYLEIHPSMVKKFVGLKASSNVRMMLGGHHIAGLLEESAEAVIRQITPDVIRDAHVLKRYKVDARMSQFLMLVPHYIWYPEVDRALFLMYRDSKMEFLISLAESAAKTSGDYGLWKMITKYLRVGA